MMEIIRVDASTYKGYFTNVPHIFNSVAFNELNKDKCFNLHYLLFKEGNKVRLGIILGERETMLCSPFSAPFGGFLYNKNEKIEYLEQASSLLQEYANSIGKPIRISLPPVIYQPTIISKSLSALQRCGAIIHHIDLNYQFEIDRYSNYENYIARNAKKNLHNSQKIDFVFMQLDSKNDADVTRAYTVIKKNRESRGFPLRMSLEAVKQTVKVVPADFFVMTYEKVDVAAAQIFHVTPEIAQVIYWGDLPEYGNLRVMNYFSYKIFEHYYNKGLKILDIGPSTEDGIPNYGLCEFKESIGCTVSAKYTFEFKPTLPCMLLCNYSRFFLKKSWNWLRDEYINYYTDTGEFSQEQSEKWFESLSKAPHLLVWGVMYNNWPIGACGLKLSPNGEKAEYWGYIGEKNLHGKGLGYEMMELVEKQAQKKQIKSLWLKVLPDNERAIRLYTKRQYVEYDRDGKFIYMKKIL